MVRGVREQAVGVWEPGQVPAAAAGVESRTELVCQAVAALERGPVRDGAIPASLRQSPSRPGAPGPWGFSPLLGLTLLLLGSL